MKEQIDELLGIAESVARKAAAELLSDAKGYGAIESAVGKDIKIVADRRAEQLICNDLGAKTSFPILSEESGLVKGEGGAGEYQWIVDPLDGSLNFNRSIPFYCISIGLWKGESPLLGVVYDMTREEMFTGIVGKGAWLNTEPISVSDVSEVGQAVLCTGFPSYTDYSTEAVTHFVQQIRSFKKIRLFGSAALSLAYVASGRVEAYREDDIKLWDVAAGLALVKAAGGRISATPAAAKHTLMVKAANGRIGTLF